MPNKLPVSCNSWPLTHSMLNAQCSMSEVPLLEPSCFLAPSILLSPSCVVRSGSEEASYLSNPVLLGPSSGMDEGQPVAQKEGSLPLFVACR